MSDDKLILHKSGCPTCGKSLRSEYRCQSGRLICSNGHKWQGQDFTGRYMPKDFTGLITRDEALRLKMEREKEKGCDQCSQHIEIKKSELEAWKKEHDIEAINMIKDLNDSSSQIIIDEEIIIGLKKEIKSLKIESLNEANVTNKHINKWIKERDEAIKKNTSLETNIKNKIKEWKGAENGTPGRLVYHEMNSLLEPIENEVKKPDCFGASIRSDSWNCTECSWWVECLHEMMKLQNQKICKTCNEEIVPKDGICHIPLLFGPYHYACCPYEHTGPYDPTIKACTLWTIFDGDNMPCYKCIRNTQEESIQSFKDHQGYPWDECNKRGFRVGQIHINHVPDKYKPKENIQ